MSELMLPGDADPDPFPGAATDPLEIIGLFAEALRSQYIQRALALIGRLGIDAVRFSGEDAFQAALTDLCERMAKDPTRPIRTLEEFRKTFAPRLQECLVDEWRRQRSKKRGGRLVVTLLSIVMDESFDPVDTQIRPPNEHTDAQDQAEWLLSLLDREVESLRAVLALRVEGMTNEGIASELGVSVSTVERMFVRIRSIWAPHIRENA